MRSLWAKIVEWLDLRSRQERKEYAETLMRPATKQDVVELFTYAFGALALMFGLLATILLVRELIGAGTFSWRRILGTFFAGGVCLLIYLVLAIRNKSGE